MGVTLQPPRIGMPCSTTWAGLNHSPQLVVFTWKQLFSCENNQLRWMVVFKCLLLFTALIIYRVKVQQIIDILCACYPLSRLRGATTALKNGPCQTVYCWMFSNQLELVQKERHCHGILQPIELSTTTVPSWVSDVDLVVIYLFSLGKAKGWSF